MTSFTIKSKGYSCSILCMLRSSGYVDKSENEFILEDENGRFHAKVNYNQAKIHYDLIVGYKHKVFSMPIALQAEKDRILNNCKGYKIENVIPLNKYWVKYQQQKKKEMKRLKKTGIISPISPFKKFI